MVERFRHVCLPVTDLGRAVRFYSGVMGLKTVKKVTIRGAYLEKVLGGKRAKLTYVKMRAPGQRRGEEPVFELHYWHGRRVPAHAWRGHIAFTIRGLSRYYRRLKRSGIRFISEPLIDRPGKTLLCFCYDPDGNLIELMEDLR